MRLVRRSVRIINKVKLGLDHFEVAQVDARTEKTEHADTHAQAFNLGIGSVAGILQSVNRHSAGFGFKID